MVLLSQIDRILSEWYFIELVKKGIIMFFFIIKKKIMINFFPNCTFIIVIWIIIKYKLIILSFNVFVYKLYNNIMITDRFLNFNLLPI